MDECTKFAVCSCPLCPLDPLYARRIGLPGEPRCTLRRVTREALAVGLLTPFGGRTADEAARDLRRERAKARWAVLSPEEQAVRKARLANSQAERSGSGRGSPFGTTRNTFATK
ncbi:MAG: hypothetical protein HZA54_04260 [Planctomycetes bacterium]|nr:hypothetical protein [Planctomycetota bacterium]